MSDSSSLAQAVLQNPSSKPVLQQPPVIHIVMYNPGIHKTYVQSEFRYHAWITCGLKADVAAAILEHNADIIMLSELGSIAEGLEPTLRELKTTNCAAKLGNYHLVEEMFLELVSDPKIIEKHPSGWSAHAVKHYGLLASKDTVRFIDEPHQVGPLTNF